MNTEQRSINQQFMDSKQPLEEKVREPIQNRFEFRNLENRVKRLEATVKILDVLAFKLAMANGIKVERYPDDIVIISQI